MTNNEELAVKLKKMANYGKQKNTIMIVGSNSRLDEKHSSTFKNKNALP